VEVGILALQGDFQEHFRAISEIGARPKLIRKPEDLPGVSGLVLPGGESTTLGMLLDSSELREPIGKLLASGLPVFGTCAGMILLARSLSDGRPDQQTFGTLDIDVRRNGFGRQRQSFECDLEVTGLDEKLHAVFIRAPMVERVGPAVVVLSEIATGSPDHLIPSESATTPVLVRQDQVLAAAFHPELTADRRLHRIFLEMIEKEGR
jgi:pyridoxal 5'-phosphate synthase pdxT subunit